MTQAFRHASGGRIDRGAPLQFQFDGRTVEGFAGDTVASALLANGIRLMGRSFKYHRPRGVLSHGSDEPNALLSVNRGPGRIDPNNRATVIEAVDGLIVRSQNRWPSLRHDIGALSDRLSPLFAVGFYYKTFMWPRGFWRAVYEPLIRRAAGLGEAPRAADPDLYAHRHAHCEVLVVGAGPAGLAAALAASESGLRVILADEQAELGGALLHDTTSVIEGLSAAAWVDLAAATLAARPNVTILTRTTAFAYYNHNHLGLLQRASDHLPGSPAGCLRERLWQVRARQVVLATGAHERPLVFPDNDRPGVMLAESARAYLNRYGVVPGRRIVVVTNGGSAYQAAADMRAAGLKVRLLDIRAEALCGPDLETLRAVGVDVQTSQTVLGVSGDAAVDGITAATVSAEGVVGSPVRYPCDCVAVSGGWTPAIHLFSQSRGAPVFDPEIDAFVPGRPRQPGGSVGAANGVYDLTACLRGGWSLGAWAAGRPQPERFPVASPTVTGFAPVRALPGYAGASPRRAFVDFQNDVTSKDIGLAVREGFTSIEHVKRYTTTGMATDQGKTSNMNGLGLVAEILRRPIPDVGTTTFRPPYTPVSFGAIAGSARGRLFEPVRETPTHAWATARAAVFEPVGLWRRARYFPQAGEDMAAAVSRECRTVRRAVGLFDASTLGKIEVVGPDAAEFMNRIYINAWRKLAPGRCRYGVMLKEDGYVFDDGVVARLSDDRFHVTTTTGGAPRVLAHMEDYLQTEWPDLKVYLTSVTEQWAVLAVQGPKARAVLAPLVSGVDLSDEAFPHMAIRTGRICGAPVRLFRVSFTGELGYEVNVPAGHGAEIWEALVAAGQVHGATPYGTEAMHVLRAERGFIIVGQETDGTVTPDDLGLGGMIPKSKGDFVGKRSLSRPDLLDADRKQLVGLRSEDPGLVLEEGAQIVDDPKQAVPVRMLGHVTSAYWSDACGHAIALALVAGGRRRLGEVLHVTTPSGFARATVSAPVFFDADGERVNG